MVQACSGGCRVHPHLSMLRFRGKRRGERGRGEGRREGKGRGRRGGGERERGSLIQLFKEKIEVEKLTTEPVVASSQPIEKPRCFVAQSQLMGEVQCIILIKGMEKREERGRRERKEETEKEAQYQTLFDSDRHRKQAPHQKSRSSHRHEQGIYMLST